MSNPKFTGSKALVMGGGGIAGIAWMTGVLLGLQDEGIEPGQNADVLIGTSAGSTVAAQIAGNNDLSDLFERQILPDRQVAERVPKPHLLELAGNAFSVLLKLNDPVERTRRIGEMAAKAKTIDENTRRQVIAARLPQHEWPARMLKIVAVNIVTGAPHIFDHTSGVNLVDAVAASCAVPGLWPPVSINGNRYMDGGILSSDNAFLAAGYCRIVILSPLGSQGVSLPGNDDLLNQVEKLRKGGAEVTLIEPDKVSRHAIGHNPLSPDTRIPAANAGRAQGRTIAASLVF